MKNKINWGNLFVLILFSGSAGLFIGDTINVIAGNTLTWFGVITGLVNVIIMSMSGIYVWEAGYEK